MSLQPSLCTIDRLAAALRDLAEPGEPCGIILAWPDGEPTYRVRLLVGSEVVVFAEGPDLDAAIVRAAEVAEQMGLDAVQVEFAEAASW
jgi:hypothetical protein